MNRKPTAAVAAAALATVLSAVLLAPTPAVSAPIPGCGSVVTTDVTLTADITGCEAAGLVVGRDGITIDLAGHTISGPMPGLEVPGSVGIEVARHDRVTIEGQKLEGSQIIGFETAVLLVRGADRNTVQGLNLRGGRFGVMVRGSHRNRVDDNSIAFAGGERPEACAAGPDAEAGIALVDSDDNEVRRNVAQLGLFGILLHRADYNTVSGNQAAPTWSDGNVCDGIALFNADDNRVVDNVTANDVPHGIRVAPGSGRNVVRGNVAFQNGGDGILVENRTTTVKLNTATRNQGWGINAVRGVTAGSNRAAENFGPGQCRNVACTAPAPPG